MLEWGKLLNSKRRKEKFENKTESESLNSAAGRLEIERDYDRILFATPTRRMADKTQVFPLDQNDSVRTRLTHSHEVANLARSIGVRLAFDSPEKVFGSEHDELNVKRVVPPLLAAIGLAHDLGNPPFGHQGETAIQNWFKENKEKVFESEKHDDFLKFDGNAQTFRLLTKLQILNDDYGLNLTYATLAALIKYPTFWENKSKHFKKAGVFESEREIVTDIWKETGLREGIRHPFTYIMEACDDIAYSILDAEDTIKKGFASFYDLIDHLEHRGGDDEVIRSVVNTAKNKNKEFKSAELSSSELNDISTQMLRVKAISEMINATVEKFTDDIKSIMSGDTPASYELIKESKANMLCKHLKSFDLEHGYKNKSVLKLELEGSNYIQSTMDMLWTAISDSEENTLFNKYVMSRISENYQRVYKKNNTKDSSYPKAQLLSDFISGMSDSFLISIHDELKPLHDGFRSKK